jgi:Ni,Fe-hydrogenase I small subunit
MSAQLEGLGSFGIGAGQDNDPAAHFRSKLNSKVTKATNAHDAHGVAWLDTLECSESSCAAALLQPTY